MTRFSVILFSLSLLVSNRALNAQTSPCKPADATNAFVLAGIRGWMTSGDALRAKLSIPLVSAAAVSLVTADTTTCTRVRQSLDSLTLALAPDAINLGPRPIHVIQVGTYYAALNPGSKISGMLPVIIFDDLLRFVGLIPF